MPVYIGLQGEPKVGDLSPETVNNFVLTFSSDSGLRLCSRDLPADKKTMLKIADYMNAETREERAQKKDFCRELQTSFKDRVLRVTGRSVTDWVKACDTIIALDPQHPSPEVGGSLDVQAKITKPTNLIRHRSLRRHAKFQDTRMEQEPSLVKESLISALQAQSELKIFDRYVTNWLYEDGNENQRYLLKRALEFIQEIWGSEDLIDVNQKTLTLFSEAPAAAHLAKKAKSRLIKISKEAGFEFSVELKIWRKSNLQRNERDRFLQTGNWTFEITHGMDCLGYLADRVQINSDPTKYLTIDGKEEIKGSLELIGPKRSYVERLRRIEETAVAVG